MNLFLPSFKWLSLSLPVVVVVIVRIFLVGFFSFVLVLNEVEGAIKEKNNLVRINFGSCNKPYLEQKLWPYILDRHPDLWMWTGDIVYHDRPNVSCKDALWSYMNGQSKMLQCNKIGMGPGNASEFDNNFAIHWKNPYYKKLDRTTPIIGIYDDHDYGRNNADFTLETKQKSKEALLRFLKAEEKTDIRYHRNGLYYYYSIAVSLDPKHKKLYHFSENDIIHMNEKAEETLNIYWNNNKNEYLHIDIYLLDNRFFLKEDKENPLLGNQQWKWLLEHLQSRAHIADVNLFISGIQVFGEYRAYYAEQWYRYSKQERLKLFNIFRILNNPIFISGDVHFGEIQKLQMDCKDKNKNKDKDYLKSSFPLYEITSSGMTHSWKSSPTHLFYFPKYLAAFVDPDGFSLGNEHSLNFGEIDITWDPDSPHSNKTLFLRVYNTDGYVSLQQAINIAPSSLSVPSISKFFSSFDESNLSCEIAHPYPLWKRQFYFACLILIFICTILITFSILCGIPCFVCSRIIRVFCSKRSSRRIKKD